MKLRLAIAAFIALILIGLYFLVFADQPRTRDGYPPAGDIQNLRIN